MQLAVTVSCARFRQSEIQNLNAGLRDHDVTRLQIAVNDAFAVRLRQCSRNLRGIQEGRLQWKRSAFEPGRDGQLQTRHAAPDTRRHLVRIEVGVAEIPRFFQNGTFLYVAVSLNQLGYAQVTLGRLALRRGAAWSNQRTTASEDRRR